VCDASSGNRRGSSRGAGTAPVDQTVPLDQTLCAGVDVGGRRKGFHSAVVDGHRRVVAGPRQLAKPGDVVAWLAGHRPAVVAVDSPCCLAPDGTRSRPDERRFAREILNLRYTPDRAGLEARASYYEWIAHGLELYAALTAAGLTAIECFPTACWTIWMGPRGRESRARWSARALAARNLVGVPPHLGQDGRDAIAAALTAVEYHRGRTRRIGDIVVPAPERTPRR
jgi:predicted nuclease with RNAse H fold